MNDKEKTIYSRQITLPEVGEAGQEELQEHGVLIVGMGGLGCPVAHYLISSGIGYLTIMDPDKVELSNLSRQPLYAEKDVGKYKVKVAKEVLSKRTNIGILVCGSGTGMAMSANKFKKIRAAVCYNEASTRLSRLHNNANILALGSRLTKKSTALKLVNIFLSLFLGVKLISLSKEIIFD